MPWEQRLRHPKAARWLNLRSWQKEWSRSPEYAKTNSSEAFAETFALYKLNSKGIELLNPRLAAWFKRQGFLSRGK